MTSLYTCTGSCGKTVRFDPGHDSLKCLCDALPLGTDRKHPFDRGYGCEGGLIGPPRPYYSERENLMVESPDDGREVEDDLREGVWFG